MYIHVDKHLKLTGAPLSPLSESNMNMYYYLMQVDRRKIEEMRLPEKITFTLPPCDASFMKVKAKLIDENSDNEILLETEELHVPLTLVSDFNQQFFFFFRAVVCVCFLWGNGAITYALKEDEESQGSLKINIRFRKLDYKCSRWCLRGPAPKKRPMISG